MNLEEMTRIVAECDTALREEKRRHSVLVENAELKHRDNVNNENDRFRLELRRLKAETDARRDEIIARKDAAKVALARERDKIEAPEKEPD